MKLILTDFKYCVYNLPLTVWVNWWLLGQYDSSAIKDGYKYFGEDFCNGDDEETDGDIMEFDRLATKMVKITSDGGVMKQVIVQGVGDVVPAKAFVTGTCIAVGHTSNNYNCLKTFDYSTEFLLVLMQLTENVVM